MEIRSIRLPKTQRFAARRRIVKSCFSEVESMQVFFGYLLRTFRFDGSCIRRPKLRGPVVASCSLSETGNVTLQFYAVLSDAYTPTCVDEFETVVLPRLRKWVSDRSSRPPTAILGYEMVIVEWTGSEHCQHTLRFEWSARAAMSPWAFWRSHRDSGLITNRSSKEYGDLNGALLESSSVAHFERADGCGLDDRPPTITLG